VLGALAGIDLDLVSGGSDPNFKECVLGSAAGGPPGLYPSYTNCAAGTVGDLMQALLDGVRKGSGKGGGLPKLISINLAQPGKCKWAGPKQSLGLLQLVPGGSEPWNDCP
jgi:hypothetical protein